MSEPAPCPVCKQPVYRNKRGEVLAHTSSAYYGGPAAMCRGATKGARP